MKGWVYIITNNAHEGLVKIGHTTRTPADRAAEMTGTHSPFPYVVEYKIMVTDSIAVEKLVHKQIDHLHVGDRHRNGAGKGGVGVEWFRMPLEDAIAVVKDVAAKHSILNQPKPASIKAEITEKRMTSVEYLKLIRNIGETNLTNMAEI